MRASRTRLEMAIALLVAGCTAPRPPTHPVVQAAAPPTLVVPPPVADWRDVPLTPGTWRYRAAADGSIASYGSEESPLFSIGCDRARHEVRLVLLAGAAGPLTIRTSSSTRALAAGAEAGALTARLAARDPFLDEIAFSRGRFSVAASGMPTLYLPSWAEPSRVIEDCRG